VKYLCWVTKGLRQLTLNPHGPFAYSISVLVIESKLTCPACFSGFQVNSDMAINLGKIVKKACKSSLIRVWRDARKGPMLHFYNFQKHGTAHHLN